MFLDVNANANAKGVGNSSWFLGSLPLRSKREPKNVMEFEARVGRRPQRKKKKEKNGGKGNGRKAREGGRTVHAYTVCMYDMFGPRIIDRDSKSDA